MDECVLLDVGRLALSSANESSSPASLEISAQMDHFSSQSEHAAIVISPDESSCLRPNSSKGPSVMAAVTSSHVGLHTDLKGNEWSDNGIAECRICQEEEDIVNLETPCACSGSLKFAHRKCVQHWCNEKGDTTCEICHQAYKSGYTAPVRPSNTDSIAIDLSEDWSIPGVPPIELHDPRILAMAAAQRHFLEAEYGEYNTANSTGAAACFRSAALVLMALLLLRHALAMAATTADEDPSMFFTLFLLRAAGFLLPCYIMARAMNMLRCRRQRQEAAIAAAEVAILLQTGQGRGMHLSLTPGSSVITQELP
eukprot:c22693_g1_i1 orf=570-1502(+)